MKTKICKKCGIEKSLNEFHKTKDGSLHGVRSVCKDCRAKEGRSYRQQYPERVKSRNDDWATRNPAKARARLIRYYEAHKEEVNRRSKEWKRVNPERAKQIVARSRLKKLSTPKGRLENTIRTGVNRGVVKGGKMGRRTFDLLGYTVEDLRSHLERLFVPDMSWDNYGADGWEIDHKTPLSAHNYSTPDDIDFKKAWALSNLQPMWRSENRSKHTRLTTSFQPSLALALPANDNSPVKKVAA